MRGGSGSFGRISPVYFAYWTLGAVLLGMLVGPYILPSEREWRAALVQGENHSKHLTQDHMMNHGRIEIPAGNAPNLSISVIKDSVSGWNLAIAIENFRFTPDNVNLDAVPNEGHAHIYVDGQKIARLYGPHFHLSEFPSGTHEIEVTLNANTHQTLTVDGIPVSAVVQVEQP